MIATKQTRRLLIACVISVILGFTLPFANVIYFLLLACAVVLSLLISLILIFTGFSSDKQLIKKGMTGLLVVCLFLICGFGLGYLIRNQRHKIAIEIISKVEAFKLKNQSYPKTIDEIGDIKKLKGLQYYQYDSLRQFRIEYLMDGFNKEYYESKTESWGTLGWND